MKCATTSGRPRARGSLHRLLSGLEHAEPRARTDFAKPLHHFQEFLRRRGIVVFISDFYESPEHIVRTIEPLRFHGNEVVLFHVLDPKEIRPEARRALDADRPGNAGDASRSLPNTRATNIARKWTRTSKALRDSARGAGHGLLPARHRPAARRCAARISHDSPGEELNGLSRSLVSGGRRRWSVCRSTSTCCGGTRRPRVRSVR